MEYYSSIADGYDELYGEEQLAKIKLILAHIAIEDTETVLDIGCGTAIYANLFPNYTGIDAAEKMLKNRKCILGDAEALPFPDQSFDVVMSITAIHNVKDTEKALQEMKRVTKGKVIISLLKKSSKYDLIKEQIEKYFKVVSLEEEKDTIFISQ